MNETTSKSAARLLVDCLVTQGCDRIFTVPGESFLPVLDALHDTGSIQTVTCRQEGGAAFMACADGAMTGRPGVCFVTRGPGATQASVGVHTAFQDSTPMILFVGDVGSDFRDREAFQEVDFAAMFAPLAKWAARIDSVERIPEYVNRAMRAGARGYVLKDAPSDEIVSAIEAISAGQTYLSPSISGRMLRSQTPRPVLSLRESQILAGLSKGHASRQLAQELGLSVRTVETHRQNIKRKLNLEGQAELIKYAVEHCRDFSPLPPGT